MEGRAEGQGYRWKNLVGAIRQLRQPSITLWHPYKTHTTHESVLAFPAGLLGPNLTLLAWFDWGVETLLGSQGSSESHQSPSDTLTRLTLPIHLNQFWLSLQVCGDPIWPCWPGLNKPTYTKHGATAHHPILKQISTLLNFSSIENDLSSCWILPRTSSLLHLKVVTTTYEQESDEVW